MAFAGAQHVDASHSVFNDFSVHITNSIDPLKSDTVKASSYLPMPSNNKLFTGRDDLLKRLRLYFCARDTYEPSRRCLVHGVGGAGKTQICLRLVEQISKLFWRVFWVDATTDETIELSFRDIAADPDAQAIGVERSSTSVLQWLSIVKHDWLIIFDNTIDVGVAKYLPRGNRGNILFTSRNPNLSRLVSAENCIEVSSMEVEDAISLLLRSSRIDESTQARQVAGSIVEELFCLPLAVDQARAAIASRLCGMDDYLQMYRHHRQNLLADPLFEGASGYGRAVYGTWDLSFTAIEKMATPEAECAIFILRTFAFFHHENISEEIIKRAAETSQKRPNDLPRQLLQLNRSGNWDPFFFRCGIRILLSFSLLKSTAVFGVHSLHPLVHCWSRDRMSSEDQRKSTRFAFTLLSSSIEYRFTTEDLGYRRTLIPHIKAVMPAGQLPYDSEQYSRFAMTLKEAGHWKEAEKIEVEVVESGLRVLSDTLTSMGNLALTYINQGRWKEAEKLGVQVTESRRRLLGEDHLDTLVSMGNLALTYFHQGRWNEAEILGVQVMGSEKRQLGEEHHHTLKSMGNLASTYKSLGRWKEAEKLEVEVMASRKRVLGEDHPDTLLSMGNLAATYWSQRRWNEAEKLGVQVMESRKRLLGEEHPETLVSVNNLAQTYRDQGRWEEAEKLGLHVLESRKRVLGEEHPDTLRAIGNLALTYKIQGRWNEAEKLELEVIESRKRLLGEEHPETLTGMGNIASTYRKQGRWKEAEKLEVDAMESRKRLLGEDHPETLTNMENLALTYWHQGRKSEAEKLGAQVMESRKKVLGEEHPDTLMSMGNLALTYWGQGRLKEAEKLEVQVLELRKRLLGEEHPDTLASMGDLAVTYRGQGRWKEAEKLDVQVLESRKRVLGDEHPDTLAAMRILSSKYQKQAQQDEPEQPGTPVVSPRTPLEDDSAEPELQPRRGISTLSRMFESLGSLQATLVNFVVRKMRSGSLRSRYFCERLYIIFTQLPSAWRTSRIRLAV